MDNTQKARLVWQAAFPREGSLSEEAAAGLGLELARAADWFDVASAKRPTRERKKLKSIERAAVKLLKLTDENSSRETIARIEQFCTLPLGWRHDLRAILESICTGAGEAQRHNGGAEELCKAFGSPHGLFVARLGKIYSKFTGRRPGRCVNSDGEPGGPFLRFTREQRSGGVFRQRRLRRFRAT